jgi:NAD+ diphosphatase
MGSTLYYSGLGLDRAGDRRGDPAWVARLLEDPDTRVIPLHLDRCPVREDRPVVVPAGKAHRLLAAAEDPILLGLDGGTAVFAADLSTLSEADALEMTGADALRDLRVLVPSLEQSEAALLAYARGILHWRRNQLFCGACGSGTDPREGGHVRVCRRCGKLLFPRIEPAVIMLVELPGEPKRCLLGRHQGAAPGRFSTLAGFVEIGESLEDTVRREVAEEAGVAVGKVTYQASQAWPFPAGLMIGFRAEAVSPEIGVDDAELVEARWFTADELRARIADRTDGGLFRVDSIDKVLIEGWLAEHE